MLKELLNDAVDQLQHQFAWQKLLNDAVDGYSISLHGGSR
jgi:hypothetical protein